MQVDPEPLLPPEVHNPKMHFEPGLHRVFAPPPPTKWEDAVARRHPWYAWGTEGGPVAQTFDLWGPLKAEERQDPLVAVYRRLALCCKHRGRFPARVLLGEELYERVQRKEYTAVQFQSVLQALTTGTGTSSGPVWERASPEAHPWLVALCDT